MVNWNKYINGYLLIATERRRVDEGQAVWYSTIKVPYCPTLFNEENTPNHVNVRECYQLVENTSKAQCTQLVDVLIAT